ncbi:alanine racemase [Desulfovibrio sp. OttesenSCG-928-I05]|nr:alanine racemase [Desulfovibrio sp. OttesenSCG-928-I05]
MNIIESVDTPALLIDSARVRRNIAAMQKKADQAGVHLRPHAKAHRTPALAAMQMAAGASGITVATIGEAEGMQDAGLDDIFIAGSIAGEEKIRRLRGLAARGAIRVGVDSEEQIAAISAAFADAPAPLDLLIEIETGMMRTGVLSAEEAVSLAHAVSQRPGVRLSGVYSHEGHCYGADSAASCRELSEKSQRDTLAAANHIRLAGIAVATVSIGSTPSLLLGGIIPGVTEIRPGAYILMDASLGAAVGSFDSCAASVLATVTSKRAPSRVVLNAGAKALTAVLRHGGICATPGFGIVLRDGVPLGHLSRLYDEQGILENEEAFALLSPGDTVRILPNHICTCSNLYDSLTITENDELVDDYPVSCRGKSQ